MAEKQIVVNDKTIGGYLNDIKHSLTTYAGGNIGMTDFLASAALMISEKQELRDCLKTDAGKASMYHAMKYAAQTGLSLNPQEGKAAIMAYGGKVQYQVMKNGLIELAMQSGKVAFITSDTVRENDRFDIIKTPDGDKYEYSPARKSRGNIDGFFAAVKLTDGSTHVKYMTAEEAEEHRDKYSAMYRSKPDASPWKKSFEGMGLKTVIKALFRNLSLSADMDKAIGTDDAQEAQTTARDVTPEGPGFTAEEVQTELEAEPEPAEAQPAVCKSGPEDLF